MHISYSIIKYSYTQHEFFKTINVHISYNTVIAKNNFYRIKYNHDKYYEQSVVISKTMKYPEKIKNFCIDDKMKNINNPRMTIFFTKTIKNQTCSYTYTNICVTSFLTSNNFNSYVLLLYAFLNHLFFHKMIYKYDTVLWDVHLYNVSIAVLALQISLDISYNYIYVSKEICA